MKPNDNNVKTEKIHKKARATMLGLLNYAYTYEKM